MRHAFLHCSQARFGARPRLRFLVVFGPVARQRPLRLCLDRLAELLAALSQLHQRRQLRIESLDLLQVFARLRELPLFLQLLGLTQVLTRSRAILR
jgi:hypothetical protein